MRTAAVLAVLALAGGAAAYRHRARSKAHAAKLAGLCEPHKYRDAALVIVVDVGSSSIRASCFALVDAATGDGLPRPKEAATPVEWVLLRDSMQQQQLEGIINVHGEADLGRIEAAVEHAIDKVMAFLRAAGLEKRVRGVGFSTFVMNLVGVDANGAAVTPVFTYAGRRPSTAAYARELREKLAAQGILDESHNRTGTVIHPAYAPAEFLRLHHEAPELVDKVVKWQSISSYLLSKWTLAGESSRLPVSFTEASWSGLFDFRRCRWDDTLLGIVHMDSSKMPDLQDSATPISGLRPQYAKRWPELANTPFFLGIGDGAAANVGSKCSDASRVAVTIGTSAAIRIIVPDHAMQQHRVPAGLWCYRIGRQQLIMGGALNDGGSVYHFFSELLRTTPQAIHDGLTAAKPGQHGLTLLPFLRGERAPGWRDEATCSITGITEWTTPVDLLHASMEAVALRIAQVYSLLATHAPSTATVVASGTALTSSASWRQMIADALGRELLVERSGAEATSRGVAMLLGTALGLHSLAQTQQLGPAARARPDAAAHAVYLAARQQQQALYRRLYQD